MSEENLAEPLKDFLARHAKPYDPATDDYERQPFTGDIKSEGRSSYYNFHYYHTKVPPEVIRDLIRHYTRPGDVVLDPFCGSGMTGLGVLFADYEDSLLQTGDAVIAPRPVILNDLSPAACHISDNYNSATDPERVATAFTEIVLRLKATVQTLYAVEHYEPASGAYDPCHPEVADRLRAGGKSNEGLLHDSRSRDWDLISRKEVEKRLGFSVTELEGGDDRARVDDWIAIPATIQYAVWSDVFVCEGLATIRTPTGKLSTRGANAGKPIVKASKAARGCGGLINLWKSGVDKTTGEVLDSFSCPHCQQVWSKVQLSRNHSEPVQVSYRFDGFKMLKKGLSSAQISRSRPVVALDAARVKEVGEFRIPESFEDEPLDLGREMMRHGLLKRGVRMMSDFYTHRNLYALALLWGEILKVEDLAIRKKLQFCFTSQVMRASRLRRMRPFGPGEQLSGTLYIAALTVETNVFNLLSHAVDEYCQTFPRWMLRFPHRSFIRVGSANDLHAIANNSVDFIFTDPPFGKNIFYADCAMLWENWLRARTNEHRELVVNERRVGGAFKTVEQYGQLLAEAFSEMFRVLKPGRFAVVEFNNSDGSVFDVVKHAIAKAGFRIDGMFVFDKGVKTFKQLKGTNQGEAVVDKDVMFTLAKPSFAAPVKRLQDGDLEQQLVDAVRQYLQALPERIKADPAKYNDEHRTTATINSMLMNTLIPLGVNVERLNLPFIEQVLLLTRNFRKVGQHWYLRGEAVGGNGGGLVQEDVAVKDELTAIAWLRQKLEARPVLIGELKPLWMRATGLLPASVSQSLVLENLLVDNFWRDPDTNRWREPTPEERERLNDDRSLRVLHDAERFVAGTFSRKPSNRELCDWIRLLFETCRELEEGDASVAQAHAGFDKTEAYQTIVQLSNRLIKEDVEPAVWGAAQKQAKVAGQRLAAAVQPSAAQTARARKDDKQTMFELGS